jgi:hypothetical protein
VALAASLLPVAAGNRRKKTHYPNCFGRERLLMATVGMLDAERKRASFDVESLLKIVAGKQDIIAHNARCTHDLIAFFLLQAKSQLH